ncbi:unnamed protein product [Brachionus calyciflorus]|uniref:Uncharacterized protein n=1 Tax=Brachionus calyciflorus TaxID=104777 RepID=A0A814EN20_9BILA|nr:unnamed protein product [Brachionus calyciflorus]
MINPDDPAFNIDINTVKLRNKRHNLPDIYFYTKALIDNKFLKDDMEKVYITTKPNNDENTKTKTKKRLLNNSRRDGDDEDGDDEETDCNKSENPSQYNSNNDKHNDQNTNQSNEQPEVMEINTSNEQQSNENYNEISKPKIQWNKIVQCNSFNHNAPINNPHNTSSNRGRGNLGRGRGRLSSGSRINRQNRPYQSRSRSRSRTRTTPYYQPTNNHKTLHTFDSSDPNSIPVPLNENTYSNQDNNRWKIAGMKWKY